MDTNACDDRISDKTFADPGQILCQGVDLIVVLAERKAQKLSFEFDCPGLVLFNQNAVLREYMKLAFEPLFLLAAPSGRAQFGMMTALGQHARQPAPELASSIRISEGL
ncbi:MAG: hypothetical protein J0G95_11450 [Rhizobiales bacterium]|nr:hypothetical protein [Hyphomicrobiales bacterium]